MMIIRPSYILKLIFFCITLACGISRLLFEFVYHRERLNNNNANIVGSMTTTTPIQPKNKAMYENTNCTLFYIDVGTNIGVQIRKLYEPLHYPNAPVLEIFDKYFGHSRRSEVCAVGIELNPSHTTRLNALEKHYKKNCGYNVKIFTETAASIREENTTFWSDNQWDNLEWGASTIKTSTHVGTKQTVRTMNLARFLQDEIIPYAKTIVMKLDVEGSEHEILPHLVLSGAICSIDIAFIEIHTGSFSQQDIINVQSALALFPHASGLVGCKTVISLLDDETFLHDYYDYDDANSALNTC